MEEIKSEVALIKQSIEQFAHLFNNIDKTIEKISELSHNIGKMLAVHEERINNIVSNNKAIEATMEVRRLEFKEELKELNEHISDMQEQILHKIEKTEEKLNLTITSSMTNQKDLSLRISNLERWKWKVVGVIGVAGSVLSLAFSVAIEHIINFFIK
jgi:chromosome segregation ATPase